MTDFEADETLLLARARRALAPSSDAVNRLRASLDGALAAPPVDAAGPTATRLPRWSSRLLLATAIAGASGAIGYWSGYRAGARRTPPHVTPTIVAAPVTAPPAGIVAPVPAQPTAPLSPPTRPRPRPAREGAPPSATSPAGASLAKEVEALRAVERALRDGHPGLALALLNELDRAVPDGRLVEERRATATIARCAAGASPLGVDLAEDFAAAYPSSVYRARVEQACTQTDPDGSGDK
jgi:hypothetical protein